MSTPILNQATQPHQEVQKYNAQTKDTTSKTLQQEYQRSTQSKDWRNSLCTANTKHKKLGTRIHHEPNWSKDI